MLSGTPPRRDPRNADHRIFGGDAKEVNGRHDATAGAILAGGKSSRMGRDKALLSLNGRPMIEHVASAMRSVLGTVCVVSDRTEAYRFLNLPVIPDLVKNAGPIGGIHAALATLDAPAVLTTGCDTPFLSAPLLKHLLNAPHAAHALVARARDGLHPLCAVYRREALPRIEQFLAAGHFRLFDLLVDLRADIVDITPDLPFYHADLFANLNDPSTHIRFHDASPPGSHS